MPNGPTILTLHTLRSHNPEIELNLYRNYNTINVTLFFFLILFCFFFGILIKICEYHQFLNSNKFAHFNNTHL